VKYLVGTGGPGSRFYMGQVKGCAYLAGNVDPLTEYFWRIDTVTGGLTVKGHVFSFVTGRVFPPVDVHSDMVTHLSMDDADIDNGVVLDISGAPYFDGTIVNATPSCPGELGEALELNGTNADVTVPAMNLNSNKVTISAWVKPNGPQKGQTSIAISNDGKTHAGIGFGTDNKLNYHWIGAYQKWDSGLLVPQGRWSHVVLVVTPDEATLYLNGCAAIHPADHPAEEFDGALYLGRYQGYNNRWFNGLIDDFLMWNRALTNEEVQTIYATGAMGRMIR
jgi:hypothetical protein